LTDSLQQEIATLRSLFGSPRDPEGRAFAPLADAYRRAGDFRSAVALLREGMERHPTFLPGHVVAAQLYLEKGLLEEAVLASRRAVELDRDNEMALSLLADVLEAKGEVGESRAIRGVLAGAVVEEAPPPVPGVEAIPEPEPEPEPVMELAALAPDEAEPEPEPVMELAALAPDEPEPDPEPVMELAALAPDELEPEPEPVMELAALAPDEPEPEPEPVMELAALAPDGPEPEPVMELAALAPDEPEPEPVMELAALAPDEAEVPTDDDGLPFDALPDEEPMVTRTMAELYARQGLTDRALHVFRQLLEASPDDAHLRARVAQLSGALEAADPGPGETPAPVEPPAPPAAFEEAEADHHWTAGAQEGHEVDTPFAWTAEEDREAPAAGPAIGGYFGRMLSWEPEGGVPEGEEPA